MYQIRSMLRSHETRAQRYASPIRDVAGSRHVLADQLRLRKGRPLPITREQLELNIAELRQKEKAGILAVFTTDGVRVNLDTLELGSGPVLQNALPNRRPDSVEFDQPTGLPMDPFKDAPLKGAEVSNLLDDMAGVTHEEEPAPSTVDPVPPADEESAAPAPEPPAMDDVSLEEAAPVGEDTDILADMTSEPAPAAAPEKPSKKSSKRS